MKILKIAFQNINSLKGFHEIDFSKAPFTTSSLFAITGPTGSGKSTILDVISLGLFSQVPRLGRITKSDVFAKGAILTRNQKEAFARVTYSCQSGNYESVWAISTNRRGNLRDYEMQLLNADTGEALDLKKSEVPGKNEALIGLNYSQFIKSVLLAQGEFAQFLKAKKEERGALLEKITGTGVYRRLGILAYEKYREVATTIERHQQELEILLQSSLEEEEIRNHKTELAEKDQLTVRLEENLEVLKKQLELKKEINQRLQQIKSQEDSIKQADEAIASFEEAHGKPLRAHEEVRHVAEELRSWKLIQTNLEELGKNIQENQKAVNENLNAIAECLESTSQLTGMKSDAKNIALNLRNFQDRVSELQQRQESKRTDYSYLRQQLSSTLAGFSFKLDPNIPQEGVGQLLQLKQRSEANLKSLESQLGSINIDHLEQEKQLVRDLFTKGRQATEKQQELAQLGKEVTNLEKELKDLKGKLDPLPLSIKSIKDQLLIAEKELEILNLKKESAMLHARVEDLREKLRKGEPCPLCGALEHPYAGNGPLKEDGLEKEIQQKSTHLRKLQHDKSSLAAKSEAFIDRQKVLEDQLQNKQEELNEKQHAFKTDFELLAQKHQITDWKNWCEQMETKLHRLEDYEKEAQRLAKLREAVPIYENLTQVLEEGKSIKDELSQIYTGKDIHSDCSKLKDDWVRVSNSLENLQETKTRLRDALETKQAENAELETKLTDLLAHTSFPEIPLATKALLPEPEVHRLQTQRDELRDNKKNLQNSRELLIRQLGLLQDRESEKQQEELIADLEENQQALLNLRQRCEDLRRILKNEQERQAQANAIGRKIAEAEKNTKRWRLLKELIGDATGKKFNDFAQDLSLTQLLKLANRRLLDLSDRYQLDKPQADEDDGLIAIDEHMGGQRRSVKTLSGGETFLLSLAMALALSDLASRNVEIDSLFIDEGFGTLDPETLDQTLDTLEKLQAESSKTIGIISHVESLKERIATQVRLERNGQGYSQLSITS